MQVLLIVFLIYSTLCFSVTSLFAVDSEDKPHYEVRIVFFIFSVIGFSLILYQIGISK